jgi:hypothetical protein
MEIFLFMSRHNSEQTPYVRPGAINGPLRVLPENQRYFTDHSGKPIYLVGAHTWVNLMDRFEPDRQVQMRYSSSSDSTQAEFPDNYLDFMVNAGLNFIRLWVVSENPRWGPYTPDEEVYFSPLPWARSSVPGAIGGGNKFDLGSLNQEYFERLRTRVMQARDKGIYTSIMLFFGGSTGNNPNFWPAGTKNPWESHPFRRENNINGVDGDPDGDGYGYETHTWPLPDKVWEYQRAYIHKVIDSVHDLDNVLYEVSNEDEADNMGHDGNLAWQTAVIEEVHRYEAEMYPTQRHMIGFTAGRGLANEELLQSPADWISPDNYPRTTDVLMADGRKPVIWDTDHVNTDQITVDQAWRSFLRGNHPISMDGYKLWDNDFRPRPSDLAMRDTRYYAEKIGLASMTPTMDEALCSTRFCLRHPGQEYLAYQPEAGSAITLHIDAGTYTVEWLNVDTHTITPGQQIQAEGGQQTMQTPFDTAPAVLYLKVSAG